MCLTIGFIRRRLHVSAAIIIIIAIDIELAAGSEELLIPIMAVASATLAVAVVMEIMAITAIMEEVVGSLVEEAPHSGVVGHLWEEEAPHSGEVVLLWEEVDPHSEGEAPVLFDHRVCLTEIPRSAVEAIRAGDTITNIKLKPKLWNIMK